MSTLCGSSFDFLGRVSGLLSDLIGQGPAAAQQRNDWTDDRPAASLSHLVDPVHFESQLAQALSGYLLETPRAMASDGLPLDRVPLSPPAKSALKDICYGSVSRARPHAALRLPHELTIA